MDDRCILLYLPERRTVRGSEKAKAKRTGEKQMVWKKRGWKGKGRRQKLRICDLKDFGFGFTLDCQW
jgi:hypothetical protein